MIDSKFQKYQKKFDLIINRNQFLGKLLTSIFGVLEYTILESLRYFNKYLHLNVFDFVIKYILRGRWGGKILPLNKNLNPEIIFLPSQEILDLISRSNVVGVATCYCREIQRKDQEKPNCNHPLNTCIHIGYGKSLFEIPFKSDNLQQISKQQAKELLELCDAQGLIHQIIFFPNPNFYYVICNCCPCCCIILSKFLKLGAPQVIRSDFIAKTKPDLCKDCGVCVDWCYFGARKLINSKLEFIAEKCFGCGICVGKCGEHAIFLEKK